MSRFRHTTALHIALMSVALAGGMLLALVSTTNSAQAGCGDYVFVRNANGQLVRASSLMQDHGTPCTGPNCPDYNRQATETDGAERVRPAENVPVKIPCNGPNCSERSDLPAFPVPPPAPPHSVQESTALLLKMHNGDHEAGARFGGAPSSDDHELHYPKSIFHPPR